MRLAVSNIAWGAEDDAAMYSRLAGLGLSGVEIAPTRLFPQAPYENIEQARLWAEEKKAAGLSVCSMQSIWYGKTQGLFAGEEERAALLDYTCRGVDFAAALGCSNLVLGSPKNRAIPQSMDTERAVEDIALPFLRRAGAYAAAHGAVIALEPNPAAYGTNFVNTAAQAFALVKRAACPGLGVNLDLGALLMNREGLETVADNLSLVHHVHFSAPGLAPPRPDPLYTGAARLLREGGYTGWVSLEMARPANGVETVLSALSLLTEVFQ